MDFGMLMMSQGTPTGVNPGLKDESPTGTFDASGPQFVSVLDLVEGLEVAEMGSASDKELNFQTLSETVADIPEEKVSSDKNAALASLALVGIDFNPAANQKPVGQDRTVATVNLETAPKVANEFATFSQASLDLEKIVPVKTETRLDAESVAAWTTAFAANEIKEIDVARAAPEGSVLKRDLPISNEKLFESMPALNAESSAPVNDGAPAPSVKLQAPSQALSQEGGFVAMAAKVEHVNAQDVRIASFATMETDASGVKGLTLEPKKNASLQAKDFFLDHAEISAGHMGAQSSNSVLATAVSSKGAVTKASGDQNVVDFVADKVLNLQAAGGGSLRVGLDTKDMGQIEIKVTLRGGRVDVKISGESSELTRQLESGKAELTAKLEKHVEVGDLSITRGELAKFERAGPAFPNTATMRLTEDLVKSTTREGLDAGPKSVDQLKSERLESLRSTGPIGKSQQSEAMGHGFSRDDRRDQALNQWATFSEMRKSA